MLEDAQPAPSHRGESRFLTAFLQGTAVVILICGGLTGWLWHQAPQTFRAEQKLLASQTVAIERPPPPAPTPAPATATPPAQTGQQPAATPAPPSGIDQSQLPAGLQRLDSGLVAAPAEGLYESVTEGRLPVIRKADGLTPFKAYRRPFDRFGIGKPVIAIAIANAGLSDSATQSALDSLPPEISFALSPYAEDADGWSGKIRNRGHEAWMMLPVESDNYPRTDTGAHTMLIDAPERENKMKLDWVMGRATGYVGLIATRNPAFMKAVNDMRPVLSDIYGRGLGFVDSSSDSGTAPQSMALGQNAPFASADAWIDDPPTKENIEQELAQLEEKAKKAGSAIGIIHPLPLSYQELQQWIATLPAKGIALAPLSALTGSGT